MVVHHLACAWHRGGHAVRVFNHTTGAAPPDAPYSVRKYRLLRGSTRLGAHRFPFRQYTSRHLRLLLHDFQPDVISAHFGYPTAVWLDDTGMLPRCLVTCHGMELNEQERPRRVFKIDRLMADCINRSAGAVAISSNARSVLESMGVRQSKIYYIPNGIDTRQFSRRPAFNLRAAFSLPEQSPIVLSVGRNNWIKARDAGLHAFATVLRRMPDVYYIILGTGNRQLLPLAAKLGIADNVVFSELYGDDLTAAYQQSTVYFSSSLFELCPVSVLEAMAAGLSVVATDVSGNQDLVDHDRNGLLVPPGDTAAMADALCAVIDSESLRSRFSRCGLAHASFYDWSAIADIYLGCIPRAAT